MRREKEALCDAEPEKEGEALAEGDAENVTVGVMDSVAAADGESALRDGVPLEAADGEACDALTLGEPLAATLARSLMDGLKLALDDGDAVAVAEKVSQVVRDTCADEELDDERDARADLVARFDREAPPLPDALALALGLADKEGEPVR